MKSLKLFQKYFLNDDGSMKARPYTVYALDDQMAVKIDGNKVAFVGEGEYMTFGAQK